MSAARFARAGMAAGVLALGASCGSSTEPRVVVSNASRRLSVGEATTCALNASGTVYCWGQNAAQWQYGVAPTVDTSSDIPVPVPVPTFVSLNGGTSQHMCGITESRVAYCWGRGTFGQLGTGTVGNTGNPAAQVASTASWADIYVSRLTACGITGSGATYCWGANQSGEIGADSVPLNTKTDFPFPTMGGITFTSIVPGWLHACGIAVGGRVYCWGDNSSGQLGIGTIDSVPHRQPRLIAGADTYAQLTTGALTTCGITTDHRAMCWGANGAGQLGDGTKTNQASPTPVAGGLSFVVIATGSGFAGGTNLSPPAANPTSAHTCALNTSGTAYCWGWNGNGQLGDGTRVDHLTPAPVVGAVQLSMIGLGGSHTCGMRGNAVWCWGSNLFGQLGIGSGFDTAVPSQVAAPFATP